MYREELVVTNVTTDENFKSNAEVRKWTSLSVGHICYTVGLLDTGLTLLFATLKSNKTNFDITSKSVGKAIFF
ncbi:hypothetical protein NQ314_001282 [Rhamnusium bicolor]|uniref:Uncharacterized protein n=1 Tax=Rhamnusium bicolor TaxID=1586634 RepID=A0AAV8ZUG4_9CUCU|nr:hypothetical protein NQ314_001282 [Rhamnusium bicolor]